MYRYKPRVMKKLLCLSLVCNCLFLMGCPLQTESPIKSEDAASIPFWMTGRWAQLKDGDLTTTSYQIKADPAGRAKLQIISIDDAGQPDKATTRVAVLSTIKGQLYLSVYEKGDEVSDAGYYHYAIGRSASGDLQIVPLKEHIVSFTAAGDQLAAYIAGHADSDDYLDVTGIERYRKHK